MIKTKKLTLIQYNWLIYRPYSNFNNCPRNVLFFDHEPIYSSLVSLVSFHWGQFLGIFLFLMTLTLFKNTSLLFCGVSLNLSCQIFPHNKIHATHFWLERDRKDFLCLSQWTVNHRSGSWRWYVLITGDVNFDHLF